MEIYKYGIARQCNIPVNHNLLLPEKQSNNLLEKIYLSKKNILDKKAGIKLILEDLIGKSKSINQTNVLINILRSIEGDKKIKEKDIHKLESEYDSLRGEIFGYVGLQEIYATSIHEFENYYSELYTIKKSHLKEIATDEIFSNALLFSSYDLFNSSIKWDYTESNKKSKQIEVGLLKYAMRSIFKPTPFSSFASIMLCDTEKTEKELIADSGSAIVSFMRINSKFFHEVRKFFLTHKKIYYNLKIILNSTIQVDEEKNSYRLFINKNNYEFFNYIQVNPVIRLIKSFVEENEQITFGELVEYCMNQISAPEDEISKYLYELLMSGFIELNLEVYGVDFLWPEKVVSILEKIEDSEEKETIYTFLQNLIAIKEAFSLNFLNSEERSRLLVEANTIIADFYQKSNQLEGNPEDDEEIKKAISNIKNNVFFEDTRIDSQVSLDRPVLAANLEKLTKLFDVSLNYSLAKKEPLTNFFINNYSAEGDISLLKLYEDYYKYLKENKDDSPTAPFLNIELENFDINYNSELHTVFFDFKENYVRNTKHNYSSCAVFQNFSENDTDGIVVNALSWGYGRPINRFLYMFNDEVLESQINLNRKLHKSNGDVNVIYSEVTDSSLFNANLHEPVFDYECFMPGGNKSHGVKNPINVKFLKVKYVDQSLVLYDTMNGNEIVIQDSCLQGTKGRSKLYSLLLNFSDRITPHYFSVINQINNLYYNEEQDGNIKMYPRITFGESIVLQRKFWIINHLNFPKLDRLESDAVNFITINNWIEENNLPKRAFLTINFLKSKEEEYRKDDYKPQFVDFQNPIFYNFLAKVFANNKSIELSECLPDKEQVGAKEDCKIREFVIQWYNGEAYV